VGRRKRTVGHDEADESDEATVRGGSRGRPGHLLYSSIANRVAVPKSTLPFPKLTLRTASRFTISSSLLEDAPREHVAAKLEDHQPQLSTHSAKTTQADVDLLNRVATLTIIVIPDSEMVDKRKAEAIFVHGSRARGW
jgi:hypothetical protein